jgi:ferredoxin
MDNGTDKIRTAVYYFSGTGNSLWTTRTLAATLPHCALFNIAAEMRRDAVTVAAERVVFVFPSYAYETPSMVRRFIKRAVMTDCKYIAALVTFGSSPGGTLAEVRRLLKRKGLRLDFAAKIPAVENFIPIFGAAKPARREKRLALQRETTCTAAAAIAGGARVRTRGLYRPTKLISILFRLFRPVLPRLYRVSSKCVGCGVCVRVCPAAAVKIGKKNRPAFGGKCEVCQACLNACPAKAIRFARLRENTPHYRHPDIAQADLYIERHGENDTE